jgi:4'-phosphopantetheinyl transferase
MQLSPEELHVWLVDLDVSPQLLGELESTLSFDEIERANRFYFDRDRRNFIVARGKLRAILASYLGRAPSALRFYYNQFGKPRIDESEEIPTISFNLSHSGGFALVAVALAKEVGVDIEQVDASVRTEEVAKNFFSQTEITALSSLPPALRAEGFFNCWTRKEAYIKARGVGLSIPLDLFDVSLIPGEPAALLRTENPSDLSRWKIENLELDRRYKAAIAAAGCNWKVTRLNWGPR